MVEDMDNEWLIIFHKIIVTISDEIKINNNPILIEVLENTGFEGLHKLAVQLTYAFTTEKFTDEEINEDDGIIEYTNEELHDFFFESINTL